MMSRSSKVIACALLFTLLSGCLAHAQAPCEKQQAACSAACPAGDASFHCQGSAYSCVCGQVGAYSAFERTSSLPREEAAGTRGVHSIWLSHEILCWYVSPAVLEPTLKVPIFGTPWPS